MELIIAIDNKILSFFTKISHKFYRLTGCTNFFLAKLLLCIMMASVMTTIVGLWFPVLSYKPPPFIVVLSAFICFGLLLEMNLCDKADGAIFNKSRVKFFSPLADFPIWRFLWIILTVINIPQTFVDLVFEHKGIFIFKMLHHTFVFAAASFLYFISVEPPAPGESKIREWVEKFSAGSQKLTPIKVRN